MSDYEPAQAPDRTASVDARILAMKQLLSVRTDTELAKALGRTQGAVSHWRRKGSIPDAVQVDLHRIAAGSKLDRNSRAMVARVITLKLAPYLVDRAKKRGTAQHEWYYYSTMQLAFDSVELAIDAAIRDVSARSGRPSFEVGAELFDNVLFLDAVAEWVEQQDWTDAMGGETFVPPTPLVPQ
jgi:hypothetical protein